METPIPISPDARAYFLQQGQNIARLHSTLSAQVAVHQVRRWTSILSEIVFYALFVAFLVLAVWIPLELRSAFAPDRETMLRMGITEDQIGSVLLGMCFFIIFCSVPLLAFAILLGRHRKKNRLIPQAFHETEKMKMDFDAAVATLSL